jgi:hypothetical protein
VASVPVGLEPVAVAALTNSEAPVVNHLSDSVSIVDVDSTPRVVPAARPPKGLDITFMLGRWAKTQQ